MVPTGGCDVACGARQSTAAPTMRGTHVAMGPEFAGMAANLGRSLKEGRAQLVQAIVKRA